MSPRLLLAGCPQRLALLRGLPIVPVQLHHCLPKVQESLSRSACVAGGANAFCSGWLSVVVLFHVKLDHITSWATHALRCTQAALARVCVQL